MRCGRACQSRGAVNLAKAQRPDYECFARCYPGWSTPGNCGGGWDRLAPLSEQRIVSGHSSPTAPAPGARAGAARLLGIRVIGPVQNKVFAQPARHRLPARRPARETGSLRASRLQAFLRSLRVRPEPVNPAATSDQSCIGASSSRGLRSCSGSQRRKMVPRPIWLSSSMRPPWARTMRWTIISPRPEPFFLVV